MLEAERLNRLVERNATTISYRRFGFANNAGNIWHAVPSSKGDAWERSPTEIDRQTIFALDKQFPRVPERKILGYRDLVKLFKHVARQQNWESINGISSFVIRNVVTRVVLNNQSAFNQRMKRLIIDLLNAWMSRKHAMHEEPMYRSTMTGFST